MSIFAPDSDDCIMVPDLGGDCIHQLKIKDTKMSIDNSIKVKHPGCGPRHLAIDPQNKFAYCINEMGNSISVFNYKKGQIYGEEIQNISSLPKNWKGV